MWFDNKIRGKSVDDTEPCNNSVATQGDFYLRAYEMKENKHTYLNGVPVSVGPVYVVVQPVNC